MEITTTTIERNPSRRAAVNALAIVGFIALIIIGIGLAIYSARFMPQLASKLGGAAVSFSSVFREADEGEPQLNVVTATTTLPILDEVVATTTESGATTTTKPATGTKGTGGKVTTVTTVVTSPIAPHGDPDLSVNITAVGYLRKDRDTDTFVAARTIDADKDGAIKFTVKNIGTNVTGTWKFTVDVPSTANSFTSPTQRSLKPGDSIEYVLGFERPREGNDREISVTIDSKKDVRESNERNNEDSTTVNVND